MKIRKSRKLGKKWMSRFCDLSFKDFWANRELVEEGDIRVWRRGKNRSPELTKQLVELWKKTEGYRKWLEKKSMTT